MRTHCFITAPVLLLVIAGAVSCSKGPAMGPLPPNTDKLGQVELAPEIPAYFSLANHKSCTLTARRVPDGMAITVETMATNNLGAITHTLATITTVPGRACVVSLGDEAVAFTPTLKKQ
jgi:hypothetical protein